MLRTMHKMLIVAAMLLAVHPRSSESLLLFQNRRAFFTSAAAAAVSTCGVGVANAGIDVSGLKVATPSQPATPVVPGRAPNQPSSGPLAGTALGFQVGGGPRSEEEVRKIDEPRYRAAREAAGKSPLFLDGVPREETNKNAEDTKWMR